MQNKSVLLIGRTDSSSALLLKEEADRRGLVFDMVTPSQLVCTGREICFDETVHTQKSFLDYDVYFFRGLGSAARSMQPMASQLANECQKRVVERCFAESGFPEDKIVQSSQLEIYKVPHSFVTQGVPDPSQLNGWRFPVVVKKLGVGSSMGREVRRVDSLDELRAVAADTVAQYLIQEYLPIEYDTRVLVVGGKVLGGFHRHKREGEDFLTTTRGGKRECAVLTREQEESAVEAASLQGLEIAGVDMAICNEQLYIFEVNASPQFKVFEKKTGKSAAEAILTHLLEG